MCWADGVGRGCLGFCAVNSCVVGADPKFWPVFGAKHALGEVTGLEKGPGIAAQSLPPSLPSKCLTNSTCPESARLVFQAWMG